MFSILFVCTGNQCRSPIAVALFKKLLHQKGFSSEDWKVESAGTWTKSNLPVLPSCQQLAALLDVDISKHRTKLITDVPLESFDLVVVMESGHQEALSLEFPIIRNRLFLLSSLAGKRGVSIPDPMLASPEDARDIVRGLSEYMQLSLDEICQTAKRNKQLDGSLHE